MHEPASALTRKRADDLLKEKLPEVMVNALKQDLTFLHFSAQPEPF